MFQVRANGYVSVCLELELSVFGIYRGGLMTVKDTSNLTGAVLCAGKGTLSRASSKVGVEKGQSILSGRFSLRR
jgi:hypothetical protein